MPRIFIDDNMPDAVEFESNYVFYDTDDLDSMLDALRILTQSKRVDPVLVAPQRRMLEKTIEEKRILLMQKPQKSSSAWINLTQIKNWLRGNIQEPSNPAHLRNRDCPKIPYL